MLIKVDTRCGEGVGVTKIDARHSDCSQRSWVQFSVVRLHINESHLTIKDSSGLIARNYPRVENKVKAEQVHCPGFSELLSVVKLYH